MAKKENTINKSKNLRQPKEKKTIAEEIQLRLAQLDKKSANISNQIESLQKKLDDANKLKPKIEKLKNELVKVNKTKALELDEIALMCNIYKKEKEIPSEKLNTPKTKEESTAEEAYTKLS